MNVYVYCADFYCEDCGKEIRSDLFNQGLAPSDPNDEYSYDSDDFPKGPYPDGGGESDGFHHCGCGDRCLNALEDEDGHKIGAFLENTLTDDGIRYVCESLQSYVDGCSGSAFVLDEWADALSCDYWLEDQAQGMLDAYIYLREDERNGFVKTKTSPVAKGDWEKSARQKMDDNLRSIFGG